MLRFAMSLLLLIVLAGPAFAGTGYEVTSMKDGKTVTYMVNFGGGFRFEQHTAYDPASKKFVYLQWPRDGKPPKPVGEIWVHQTGETLKIYKFPDVKHPLPVIPSIKAMKVCPKTGDKKLKSKPVIAYD